MPELVVRAVTFCVMGGLILQGIAVNEYVISRMCDSKYGHKCDDLSHDDKDSADDAGSMFYTACTSASGLLSIFTTVYLAVLSDYTGRKPILLLNLASFVASWGIVLAVVLLKLPVSIMLGSSLVSGIGGSMGTLLALLFAHTASINDPSTRCLLTIRVAADRRSS